jgi:cell division protein FtsW (lipid II flippase)
MQRRLSAKDVMVGLYLGVLLFGSDLAMAAVVVASKWFVGRVTTSSLHLIIEWFVAAIIIMVGSYVLALPVLRLYRGHPLRQDRHTKYDRDQRFTWFTGVLKRGGALGFLVGSLAIGAPGIAWWYGRRGSSHMHTRMLVSAAILGFVWSATLVGAFQPRDRIPSLLAIVGLSLLIIAIRFRSTNARDKESHAS